MKKYSVLILPLILFGYGLLYIATSRQVPCEADCEAMVRFDTTIVKNRDYVWYSMRCGSAANNDSICVYVNGTANINWNLFADTCCQVATQAGLNQQKIFILKSGVVPADTLAKKICP